MKKREIKFVPYKSKKNGLWYWKAIGGNGEKIASGHEPFTRRPTEKTMEMLKRNFLAMVYSWKAK